MCMKLSSLYSSQTKYLHWHYLTSGRSYVSAMIEKQDNNFTTSNIFKKVGKTLFVTVTILSPNLLLNDCCFKINVDTRKITDNFHMTNMFYHSLRRCLCYIDINSRWNSSNCRCNTSNFRTKIEMRGFVRARRAEPS